MTSTPTPSAPLVLVIDDEPDLRTLYELTLLREGYRVEAAGNLTEARQLLGERRYEAVITDMRLPDGLGLELLKDVQSGRRPERCIVITAYGSAENAVEALKAGAFDYLTKPVDLKQFRTVVSSAIHDGRATRETELSNTGQSGMAVRHAQPGGEIPAAPGSAGAAALDRLVGTSEALRAVKSRVVRIARSMAPVLVRGESGTGKELVALAIHACSHRADGPFVAVNCGAIPESLLEAEFFGARKGSYTGAATDREGFFQAAHGGTLFLDEIGDLPLAMQAKLLRVIQERKVRPLGATKEEPVDVRIVSATHHDLAAGVQAKTFRQDLYYRLNVIELILPPLRERRSDIAAIAQVLLAKIAQDSGLPPRPLSRQAQAALQVLPLDGNVRELENILQRALAMSDGEELEIDAPGLEKEVQKALSGAFKKEAAQAALTPENSKNMDEMKPLMAGELPQDLGAYLDAIERDILVRALQENGYNRTATAQRLGITLRQVRYRIQQLGIDCEGGDE